MESREKIILGVAGAAVLYFVINAVAGSSSEVDRASTGLSRECDQFLDRGKQTLQDLKDSPELFRHIALLEGRTDARNPFVRNMLQAGGAALDPMEEAPRQRVRYTGYFSAGGRRMVVINEQEYSLNERIEGTDLRIMEICPEQVVLQSTSLDDNGLENTEIITVLKEVENYVFNR